MAYLAMTMTNLVIATHGKKGAKQVTLKDFMPNFAGEETQTKVQTIDEMKAAMQRIADAFKKRPGNQADPKRKPKLAGIQSEQTPSSVRNNGRHRNNDRNIGSSNKRNRPSPSANARDDQDNQH